MDTKLRNGIADKLSLVMVVVGFAIAFVTIVSLFGGCRGTAGNTAEADRPANIRSCQSVVQEIARAEAASGSHLSLQTGYFRLVEFDFLDTKRAELHRYIFVDDEFYGALMAKIGAKRTDLCDPQIDAPEVPPAFAVYYLMQRVDLPSSAGKEG